MPPKYQYDIAISFAGEDRKFAKKFAEILRKENINVFYDEFKEADLWGKNGYEYFVDVFAHKSKYCLMLISQHYERKVWPNHERKAAQSRAIKEEEPYILPVRLDDTNIPGFIETVFYQDLRRKSVEEIASLILQKLNKYPSSQSGDADFSESTLSFSHDIRMPRVKRSYTDLEKEEFLESGYNYVKNFIEEGLQKLGQSESSIEIKFTEKDSQTCVGYIYREGKLVQGFKLWIGGLFDNQSICLRLGKHNIDRNENSYNEIISVKEDDNQLILTVTMGSLSYGNSTGLKTNKEVAEYIWTGIIRPLEY